MQMNAPATQVPFNPAINGFRGLCALLVFTFHVFGSGIVVWPRGTPSAEAFVFLFGTLRFGVELFFMISGYVILASLVRHAHIGAFFRDRAIRIFSLWLPLHLCICAAGTIWGLEIFPFVDLIGWWRVVLGNLLLVTPFSNIPTTHAGSWSLSYEWLFYFAAALSYAVYRLAGRKWAVVAASCLGALFIESLPRAVFFLSGVIALLAGHTRLAKSRILAAPLASLLVFLLAWGATGVDAAEPGHFLSQWFGDYRIAMAVLAFLAGTHFFCCLAYRSSRQLTFLETRFFQFMGTISFSFYLVAPIVMFGVKRIVNALMSGVFDARILLGIFAVTSLLLSMVASHATWALLEKRLARYLKNLTSKKNDTYPLLETALAKGSRS